MSINFNHVTNDITASSGSVSINGSTPGVGMPAGGASGQVLAKASATDYDTTWVNQSGGGGGSSGLESLFLLMGA